MGNLCPLRSERPVRRQVDGYAEKGQDGADKALLPKGLSDVGESCGGGVGGGEVVEGGVGGSGVGGGGVSGGGVGGGEVSGRRVSGSDFGASLSGAVKHSDEVLSSSAIPMGAKSGEKCSAATKLKAEQEGGASVGVNQSGGGANTLEQSERNLSSEDVGVWAESVIQEAEKLVRGGGDTAAWTGAGHKGQGQDKPVKVSEVQDLEDKVKASVSRLMDKSRGDGGVAREHKDGGGDEQVEGSFITETNNGADTTTTREGVARQGEDTSFIIRKSGKACQLQGGGDNQAVVHPQSAEPTDNAIDSSASHQGEHTTERAIDSPATHQEEPTTDKAMDSPASHQAEHTADDAIDSPASHQAEHTSFVKVTDLSTPNDVDPDPDDDAQKDAVQLIDEGSTAATREFVESIIEKTTSFVAEPQTEHGDEGSCASIPCDEKGEEFAAPITPHIGSNPHEVANGRYSFVSSNPEASLTPRSVESGLSPLSESPVSGVSHGDLLARDGLITPMSSAGPFPNDDTSCDDDAASDGDEETTTDGDEETIQRVAVVMATKAVEEAVRVLTENGPDSDAIFNQIPNNHVESSSTPSSTSSSTSRPETTGEVYEEIGRNHTEPEVPGLSHEEPEVVPTSALSHTEPVTAVPSHTEPATAAPSHNELHGIEPATPPQNSDHDTSSSNSESQGSCRFISHEKALDISTALDAFSAPGTSSPHGSNEEMPSLPTKHDDCELNSQEKSTDASPEIPLNPSTTTQPDPSSHHQDDTNHVSYATCSPKVPSLLLPSPDEFSTDLVTIVIMSPDSPPRTDESADELSS